MQTATRTRMDNNPAQKDDDVDPDDEDMRTVFCANLSEAVTEELLYELFIQSGPIESVRIPKDKDGRQRQFGFVTFAHACSVPYAMELYDGTRLFQRDLVIRFRNPSTNLGKRRRIDSNTFSEDKCPPAPTRRRIDDQREPKEKQKPDNSALRAGAKGNMHSRLDSHMQPSPDSKRPRKGPDSNPFKLNDLQNLGTELIIDRNVMGSLFDSAIRNAFANPMNRQLPPPNPNPFRNMHQNSRGFNDQGRGRADNDKNRHRGRKRR